MILIADTSTLYICNSIMDILNNWISWVAEYLVRENITGMNMINVKWPNFVRALISSLSFYAPCDATTIAAECFADETGVGELFLMFWCFGDIYVVDFYKTKL